MNICIAAQVTWLLAVHGVPNHPYGWMCFTERHLCLIAESATNRVFQIYGDYPNRYAECVEQAAR